MPFLRRRQENEPSPPAPEPAPAAPATAPPPEVPVINEPPPVPEAQVESPVESQFQPVEGADEMLDMPLGTLIFRAGLIAPQQLEDALAEGLRSGKRLGEVLLSRGWLSEEDLSRLLAGQKGLPYADLDKIAIDRELAQAMSYDDALAEMALPVVSEFGVPVVAMADPDEAAMDRLRAQLGSEIRFVVAAPSVLTHLLAEVLGGAPAPGLVVAPAAAEQYPTDDLSAAELVPLETAPEPEPATPEPATPEPAVVDSIDQEIPVSAPDLAAQEIRPIIAEGEVDYPTFTEYQPIPQPETISGAEEQLPEEVQMGDYGYYDDSSLLEGNAWRAGETEPPAAEPAPEAAGLSADEGGAALETEQPLEAEQPVETEQPLEAEQPLEPEQSPETEQPFEAEQPLEAEQLLEEEQPLEAEQPTAEAWEEPVQESYPEATPEPVEPEESASEPLPEPLEEVASPASEEEDLLTTTPAWMRGEVNVITADVADFIDSGAPYAPEPPASLPVESGDVAESELEPVASDSEALVESAPAFEGAPEFTSDDLTAAETLVTEAEAAEQPVAFEPMEAVEPTEPDSAGLEPGVESPSWASEASETAEQVEAGSAGDVSPEEPVATPASVEREYAAGGDQGEFELVLRLADGDRIEIGSFHSIEKAQERAGEVVKQFADMKEGGGWPFIGGRFLRPETIVSIDVEQHGTGWGGSNSRGRMFSGD